MEKVKLGDEVYFPSDIAPFKVVGIRADELEIEGDFSGGMVHKYSGVSWVKRSECKPYKQGYRERMARCI
jgi:hypothetical protein